MKRISKEVQIAIVAIVGIVVLYAGLQFLKGLSLYSNDATYYVSFNDISGLSPSCAVYANGFRIGVVKDIKFSYGADDSDIIAELGVDKRMQIPTGSKAEIESDMLGNVKINLLMANNPRERVNPGDVIKGVISSGAMGQLQAMIPTVERILPKLDSIMTSLNAILADPAIRQSLKNVETITANLSTSTQQLNTLMTNVNRSVPGMMAKADRVLDNTETVTSNLASLDLQTTMQHVDQTIANVERMTAKLNSREGFLGRLMTDPSLYNHLTNTVPRANTPLLDLKSHPQRYVHFSIFGKPDK